MKYVSFALALCMLLAVAPAAFADSPGPFANPNREYPPSCVALPFPLPGTNEPVWSASVTLPTVNSSFQVVGSEVVTYFFWRTPCSGGKSALLGQVARDQSFYNTSPTPVFGQVLATQGSAQDATVRTVLDPNTLISGIDFGQIPVYSLWTFVLEEGYTSSSTWIFDYSQAMTLTINGLTPVQIDIPAYNSNQYATANLPMQISGYMAGNWFDPAHGGEGIQTEIGEFQGANRYIVMAWYTYDLTGTPYWLFGSASFTAGDRSVTISQVAYQSGGSFAGTGSSATPALWGSMTIAFPDCNTMQFSYQSVAGLPSGVPTGSGTRTWTRLTQMNGLTCQ